MTAEELIEILENMRNDKQVVICDGKGKDEIITNVTEESQRIVIDTQNLFICK